jgi:hypothetical protein
MKGKLKKLSGLVGGVTRAINFFKGDKRLGNGSMQHEFIVLDFIYQFVDSLGN